MHILTLLILSVVCVMSTFGEDLQGKESIEEKAEKRALELHKIDSVTLSLYTILLIITILTVWLFKHRRFKYFHESGMTLLIGLIVGLLVRVSSTNKSVIKAVDVSPVNSSLHLKLEPTYLRLKVTDVVESGGEKKSSKNLTFYYELLQGSTMFDSDEKQELRQMDQKATFSPEIFFNILLPPIIFNAGYSLKKRNFFRNIGSIMMFAFLGTTISCLIVGLFMYLLCYFIYPGVFDMKELMYFGALISATDPVTVLALFSDLKVENDLFAIVFGESALNDAVAIVLATTVEQYNPNDTIVDGITPSGGLNAQAVVEAVGKFFFIFTGSFLLGSVVGCVTALVTKYTKIAEYPLLETSLFLLMSYLSFLIAEAAQMTGIVAVLFCGICQAHYTFNNLSEESRSRTKQFFDMANFLSENFIFTYIGISMFTSRFQRWYALFILGAFVAIVLGRAAHIYPFSFLMNLKRKPKIPSSHQHMLMFSGLRGAIAFALAIRNTSSEARQVIFTTTSMIVIGTVIFNGGFTQALVEFLGIRTGVDPEHEMQPSFEPVSTSEEAAVAANAGESTESAFNPWDKSMGARHWYNFDRNIMKPLLTHARPNLMETMPECCLPIARILTSTIQLQASPTHRQDSAGEVVLTSQDDDDTMGNHEAPPGSHLSRSNAGASQNDDYDADFDSFASNVKLTTLKGEPV